MHTPPPEIPGLDTRNPDALQYPFGQLHLTLLGGIRTDGLDRLRVTLKITVTRREHPHYLNHPELAGLALRHNLDLYNDAQVEKLIRKTAERLEVGSTLVAQALAGLTEALEAYRLTRLETQRQQQQQQHPEPLTEAEHSAALDFLTRPSLMARTNEQIGQSGVVGEETNRLLLYLIYTTRKMRRPLHAVCLGSSGVGKSHLQESIGQLIPPHEKIEITTLTENAFYYFGQQELHHKLILIEDLDGAENVLYPLRELQSKRRITKTLTVKTPGGHIKTQTLSVEGPVSVSGCTTRETLYEDNANRSFLLHLDESPEQDQRIMDYQRAQSAGHINHTQEHAARTLLQHTQRLLQPLTVRNPYAPQLRLPEHIFKPRRTHAHYLQFIEAVTFYHQYQRPHHTDPRTGETIIHTTPEDIAQANTLMKEALLRKTDELPKSTRQYLEQLKTWLEAHQQTTFTAREARLALRVNPSNQKRWHLQLVQGSYLTRHKTKAGSPPQYSITSYTEYQQLQTHISTILDQTLAQLTSPPPVHPPNEPPNPQKTSKKQPRSTPAHPNKVRQEKTTVTPNEAEGQTTN